jgi:hypothetical protein
MTVVGTTTTAQAWGALELDPGVGTDAAWARVDLLLEDEQWLHEEFEALTADLEQPMPPQPCAPDHADRPRSRRHRRRWAVQGPPAAGAHGHVPGRERSPPG